MTEKHDKSMGIWTDFARAFIYAVYAVCMVVTIAVVVGILPVSGIFLLLQQAEPEQLADAKPEQLESLKATTATYMLSIVVTLYIIQTFAAIWMSLKPQKTRIVEVRGIWKEVYLERISILGWTKDDAFRSSGPWIFLIVAIFLPVMVSIIPDVVSTLSSDATDRMKETTILTKTRFMITGITYYLCLSLIAVLITVEASILMSLKDTAEVWIGMVLVTIILDIASFLVLYGMEDPLEKWNGQGFEATGPEYFLILSLFLYYIQFFNNIVRSSQSRNDF